MIREAFISGIPAEIGQVKGQKYNVTYKIYAGSAGMESMSVLYDGNGYVAVESGKSYELTNDDYVAIGKGLAKDFPAQADQIGNYKNFERRPDNAAYWKDFMIVKALDLVLKTNFPEAAQGENYEVTYKIYNGSSSNEIMSLILNANGDYVVDENAGVSTVEATNVFALTGGNWTPPFSLQHEDYTAMGQKYPNFSDKEEAVYKIGIFLDKTFPYAEPGDFEAVTYKYYKSGKTTPQYVNYTFNGDKWAEIPSTIEQTLQFGNDGSTWVPDDTIAYTLAAADYTYIAEALKNADGFVAAAGNLGNYGNFNRAGGASSWSDEMITTAMVTFLDHIDSNAEEGQKYAVSFSAYNGSNVTETVNLIRTDGKWTRN